MISNTTFPRWAGFATLGFITLLSGCHSYKRPLPPHEAPSAYLQELENLRRREQQQQLEMDRNDFTPLQPNPFQLVSDAPLSTFSIDVDTASYSIVRKYLEQGRMPPQDAVRVEEMLNYFEYDYPEPEGEEPMALQLDLAPCPWRPANHLLRVALKGRELPSEERPPLNLVFLLDVSGSMKEANKLPLVKRSMKALLSKLDHQDRVAIVAYSGQARLVLRSSPGHQKRQIEAAIDSLQAGGRTAGSAGIDLAYQVAEAQFMPGGVNRVVLCSDGDFNVGKRNQRQLADFIQDQAGNGVELSVLGFGMGNLKDGRLESLSAHGQGNYAYINSYQEAHNVLVEQLLGTLVTLAKDVKIQIEFNPSHVSAYRLIGYENRELHQADFNDDRVDAAEMGAGQRVTALYELVPPGVGVPQSYAAVDALKYKAIPKPADPVRDQEILTVKLRYKAEGESRSTRREQVLPATALGENAFIHDSEFRFASAVAAFGQYLQDDSFRFAMPLETISDMASSSRGKDPLGHRSEFLKLVRSASSLQP